MQIKETIHQNLYQLELILHQLTDVEYSTELHLLNGQTIGKHVRHIIEFYQCLIKQNTNICYDKRERNLLLETSINYTRSSLNLILDQLEFLDLVQTINLNQLVNDDIITVKSTIGRELLYCLDHSIHHFAIIKMAIETHFPNINLTEEFGVAFSTLKFKAENQ